MIKVNSSEVAVQVAVSQFAATFGLVDKDQSQNMPLFKKARFVYSDGSSKGSYILFYVWNAQKNKLVRKRIAIPKQYKTLDQQKAFAKDRIKQINKLLEEGYHIDANRSAVNNSTVPTVKFQKEGKELYSVVRLKDAINNIVALREAKNMHEGKRGIQFFRNTIEAFRKWGEARMVPLINVDQISFEILQEYQLFILTDKKLQPKTHNNILGVFSAFYSECIRQRYVQGENLLSDF